MKTLEQFAVGRRLDIILKIGEISSAFSNMQFASQKFHEAEQTLMQARKGENMFNYIEELGESRTMLLAKTEQLAARMARARAEKFFKRLCHELVELGVAEKDIPELKQILTIHHA